MAPTKPKGPHDKEWEAHRPTLERLYWSENLDLDRVRRVMKSEHGFIATYVTCSNTLCVRKADIPLEAISIKGCSEISGN